MKYKKGYKFIGKKNWGFGEVVWNVEKYVGSYGSLENYEITIHKGLKKGDYYNPPYRIDSDGIKSCKPYNNITKYFL